MIVAPSRQDGHHVGADEFTIIDDEVLVDQAWPYRRGIDWSED
jgi:hypothetical protein